MSYRRTMLEEQVKILKEASKVVTEELDNAKDVKMEVENAFDRIKKWYGSVYNNVKQQKLNEKYCNDDGGEGGSGYIGNTLLTNKGMYIYNNSAFASTSGYFSGAGCVSSNEEATKTTCTSNYSSTPTANYAKQGNGYARITYLGSV